MLRCQLRAATSLDMAKEKKVNPIAIRLEADVKAALEELAAADDRTLVGYIRRVLRSHVEAVAQERKAKR